MAISASELKLYKSVTNSDSGSNGGRMSTTQVVTGVANNLFPNVTNTQRTSGITRYRKAWLKNTNSEGRSLDNTYLWIRTLTQAGDYLRLHAGTNTDTQSDATAYTGWKGSGVANAVITGGSDTTLDVLADAATGFNNGDIVHISDGVNEEFITLDSTSGVSWAGSVATLTIADGATVENSYSSGTGTIIGACVNLGSIDSSSSLWSETNIHSGTYDETTYPLVTYNEGTVEDTWTLTFTGSGAFSVSGSVTGSVGSGTTSSDFQPANGSSYYFKIDKDGWSGTWTTGDSITFATHHAAKSIWIKEIVPAGCASYSNNKPQIGIYGESGA